MKSKDMASGIYIVGTGGFASEVAEYILDNGEYKINGYFDIKEDD